MLEKLTIKNYLLLKSIEIDFSRGFNVITGETGAGKSILIDALSLLLGERADYSIISKNKDKMIVEAFIRLSKDNIKQLTGLLKENKVEIIDDNSLIIRRELYTKGYSRNFINDSPVNINDLKNIGEVIVDIHSQNEHQSLLKKEIHIELLDSYLTRTLKNKYEKSLDEYKSEYDKLIDVINEYNTVKHRKNELDQKRSYIEFQLKEINEVEPLPNEDDTLEKELKASENVEAIQQGLAVAYTNLYDGEGSVTERVKIVEKELVKLAEYSEDISKILKDISDAATVFNENARAIQSLIDGVGFDPARIEQIRERLYKLQFIKKKYGSDIESILKLRDGLQADLALLDNFDDKIKSLEGEIESLKDGLFKHAQSISKARKDNAGTLETEVVKILREVGFENAEFKVGLTSSQGSLLKEEGSDASSLFVKSKGGYIKLTKNGIDDVEFMVKINKGDEFSSLRKSASGGEVSRIMLAVKAVLADADMVDTLIFDEIDTGISGRIAQKAGKVIKKLSEYHQVISITHLAQIAALADQHFLVEKETEGNSTLAKIRRLDKNEKVIEVARLLSGEKVTDASIKSAKELMGS
jgi:DNA repair protein RecN (Recombination protein N)